MASEMESIWILPARKLDPAYVPDERGTRVSEFRGALFDLFGITVTEVAMWPKDYPLAVKCVLKTRGRGANYMEILDLLDRETVSTESIVAMTNGGLGSNGKPKPKKAK